MPARSEAQRRYLNMKFGHEWVKSHHFDNKGKLPTHAKKRGNQEEMVRRFMKRKKRRGRSRRGEEARQ